MAKKRRQTQRARKVGEAVEQIIEESAENDRFHSFDNNNLFHVDSSGAPSTSLSRKLAKRQKLAIKDPVVYSSSEWKAKINASHSKATIKAQKLPNIKSEDATFNPLESSLIWNASDSFTTKTQRKRKTTQSTNHNVKHVQVPAPGQSYHPEFHAHQEIVAKAYAEHLERTQKFDQEPALASACISDLIRQDSDDDSDVNDAEDPIDSVSPRKDPIRLTQSKRNKRIRHQRMLKELEKRKKEAKLNKQIDSAPTILHKLTKAEEQFAQRQQLKKLIKMQKLEEDPKVRVGRKLIKISRETVVPFATELKGSIRALRPKGSLLLDCFDSLHKRNLFTLNGSQRPQRPKTKYIET